MLDLQTDGRTDGRTGKTGNAACWDGRVIMLDFNIRNTIDIVHLNLNNLPRFSAIITPTTRSDEVSVESRFVLLYINFFAYSFWRLLGRFLSIVWHTNCTGRFFVF